MSKKPFRPGDRVTVLLDIGEREATVLEVTKKHGRRFYRVTYPVDGCQQDCIWPGWMIRSHAEPTPKKISIAPKKPLQAP